MAFETWLVYLLAIVGLSLAPGPNSLLALTHGALYGRKKAVNTVLGGVIGFTILIALSLGGVSAILQTSSSALLVLKWLGAGYLIWLGIQLWRTPGLCLEQQDKVTEVRRGQLFRSGLWAALANPKALLFFGAFMAQFIDATQSLLPQFLVMAITFATIEFVVECFLAGIAHHIRPLLERRGKGFNRLCGSLFVVLGSVLPLSR